MLVGIVQRCLFLMGLKTKERWLVWVGPPVDVGYSHIIGSSHIFSQNQLYSSGCLASCSHVAGLCKLRLCLPTDLCRFLHRLLEVHIPPQKIRDNGGEIEWMTFCRASLQGEFNVWLISWSCEFSFCHRKLFHLKGSQQEGRLRSVWSRLVEQGFDFLWCLGCRALLSRLSSIG